jgi:hypothetical protein
MLLRYMGKMPMPQQHGFSHTLLEFLFYGNSNVE